ncbi:hypothetical protein [Mucilaginibacter phyllosphaerae]
MKNQNLFIIGLGAGIAIGVALHNVAVGTAIGAGVGFALSRPSTACNSRLFKFKRR